MLFIYGVITKKLDGAMKQILSLINELFKSILDNYQNEEKIKRGGNDFKLKALSYFNIVKK